LEILSYLANKCANKNATSKSGKTVLQALDLKKIAKNYPDRGKKVINYLKSLNDSRAKSEGGSNSVSNAKEDPGLKPYDPQKTQELKELLDKYTIINFDNEKKTYSGWS
jgi:hypothetical protein